MGQKHSIACEHCDLLIHHNITPGSGKYKAVCPRCDSVLYTMKGNTLSLSLSLLVAAGLLIIPAFTTPIFILTSLGNVRMNTMFTGVMELFVQGLWDIALLVLLTAVIFPVLKMMLLFYTLVGIAVKGALPGMGHAFRWYYHLQEWAMVDVFMLGIMVALTKLDSFAQVSLGLGFWCLCGMLTLSTFASFFLNVELVWQEIERLS